MVSTSASKWLLVFSFLPFLPSQSVVCLTQLALFGVMKIRPCFVVETALSGLGAVGEVRLETWKERRRAQKLLVVWAQIRPHSLADVRALLG